MQWGYDSRIHYLGPSQGEIDLTYPRGLSDVDVEYLHSQLTRGFILFFSIIRSVQRPKKMAWHRGGKIAREYHKKCARKLSMDLLRIIYKFTECVSDKTEEEIYHKLTQRTRRFRDFLLQQNDLRLFIDREREVSLEALQWEIAHRWLDVIGIYPIGLRYTGLTGQSDVPYEVISWAYDARIFNKGLFSTTIPRVCLIYNTIKDYLEEA